MRLICLKSAALVAALAVSAPAFVQAQGLSAPDPIASPVLVIDQERLFRQSALGTRITEELESAAEALAAENREIEASLTAEELRLTELRGTLSAEEFRLRADEFDQKVQRLRAEQDEKERQLQRRRDADQQIFFNQIGPILGRVAQERGALIVLDRRAAFLVSDAIDITDFVIERVNESIEAEDAAQQIMTDPVPEEGDGGGTAQSIENPTGE